MEEEGWGEGGGGRTSRKVSAESCKWGSAGLASEWRGWTDGLASGGRSNADELIYNTLRGHYILKFIPI